jgi:hypothetical protein
MLTHTGGRRLAPENGWWPSELHKQAIPMALDSPAMTRQLGETMILDDV